MPQDYPVAASGVTYKVPADADPADAVKAFKDFADSIPSGLPATTAGDALKPLRVNAAGAGYELGPFHYLDRDLDETLLPYDPAKAYSAGDIILEGGILWYSPSGAAAGSGAPKNGRYRSWVPVTGYDLAKALYPLAPSVGWWQALLEDPTAGQLGVPQLFDGSRTYSPGHMVISGNKLWHANTSSTGVTPSPTTPEWTYVSLVDVVQRLAAGPDLSQFLSVPKSTNLPAAAPFDPTKVYDPGDRCTNDGLTWVCYFRAKSPGVPPRKGDWYNWIPVAGGDIAEVAARNHLSIELLWSMFNPDTQANLSTPAAPTQARTNVPQVYDPARLSRYGAGSIVYLPDTQSLWRCKSTGRDHPTTPPPTDISTPSADWEPYRLTDPNNWAAFRLVPPWAGRTPGDVLKVVDDDHLEWGAGGSGAGGATGPTGPAGPEGPQGPVGPAGPQGDPGPAGPAGADGAAGAQGLQGPAGADGPAGPAGPAGPTGADGAVGPAGPKGDPGEKGDPGAAGPKGDPGATGAQGDPGPTEVSADAGNTAKLGTDGKIMVPAELPAVAAADDDTTLAVMAGVWAKGRAFLQGSGPPAASLGKDGDVYFEVGP
jgi:hypothetical protein